MRMPPLKEGLIESSLSRSEHAGTGTFFMADALAYPVSPMLDGRKPG
jgi:hypothetical protein